MGRLFKILHLLLANEKMTAGELAERLEVSVRTIYRDIDKLSYHGIPIYTIKGKGGGIYLNADYKLNQTLLNKSQQKTLLSAIKEYSVVGDKESQELLEKLSGLFKHKPKSWIEVDFTEWGNTNPFDDMKSAAIDNKKVRMDYYNIKGEKSTRIIYPLKLWFKVRNWYVWAFCEKANDYRLFRFSRMRNVEILDKEFQTDDKDLPDITGVLDKIGNEGQIIEAKLLISKDSIHRVFDEFIEGDIEILEDGSTIVHYKFIEDQWFYGYILSFGDNIEVLEPKYLREIIFQKANEIKNKYS